MAPRRRPTAGRRARAPTARAGAGSGALVGLARGERLRWWTGRASRGELQSSRPAARTTQPRTGGWVALAGANTQALRLLGQGDDGPADPAAEPAFTCAARCARGRRRRPVGRSLVRWTRTAGSPSRRRAAACCASSTQTAQVDRLVGCAVLTARRRRAASTCSRSARTACALSTRARTRAQVEVARPGCAAPRGSGGGDEVAGDELGDLHHVERGALAQVVAADEEVERVGEVERLAQPAGEARVGSRRRRWASGTRGSSGSSSTTTAGASIERPAGLVDVDRAGERRVDGDRVRRDDRHAHAGRRDAQVGQVEDLAGLVADLELLGGPAVPGVVPDRRERR